DRLLRRGRRAHLRGYGAAARRPAAELVRPRPVLERRRPGPGGRRPAGRRDRGGHPDRRPPLLGVLTAPCPGSSPDRAPPQAARTVRVRRDGAGGEAGGGPRSTPRSRGVRPAAPSGPAGFEQGPVSSAERLLRAPAPVPVGGGGAPLFPVGAAPRRPVPGTGPFRPPRRPGPGRVPPGDPVPGAQQGWTAQTLGSV